MLESAFVNWRLPAYLGSLAYRARRVPAIFDAIMNVQVDLRTRQGATLRARLRDVNAPAEVFGLDEYATPSIDWSRLEYIVDAGAHVGSFALWAAALSSCRILALEPNPATRKLLELNVRNQKLGGRVVVRPWALAGRREARTLRLAADSAATALVTEGGRDGLEVQAVALTDVVEATGFPRIDLFKMDIEGAEHEVFASADDEAIRSVNWWIVECHPVSGADSKRIDRRMRSAGFETSTVEKAAGQTLLIARRSPG
jgi:FkbM family methyltransferase